MNIKHGFTYGAFDVFNCVHLSIICKLKNDCDALTVGVFSDELCEKIYKKKPILPYMDRSDIVISLYEVDQVIKIEQLEEILDYKTYLTYPCIDVLYTNNYVELENDYLRKLEVNAAKLFRNMNDINAVYNQGKKYNIGYTTGCFDMFHKGHLNLLKKAKQMCNYLIVGVSVDELVESYKGHPCNIPYDERVAILSHISYVDRVVPQTDLNKIPAWNELKYNVLFHGSDYKGSDLFNTVGNELKKNGVDTIFFDYTEGISSTIIRSRLQEGE